MPLIHCIVAARPNMMKMAPVYHALTREGRYTVRVIHTGQHYDAALSSTLLGELSLPEPYRNFQVGSGSHAQQTAKVMTAYESLLDEERPDLCIVPGDVNSTLACALTAAKQLVPVAHLEAGLRSFDRTMPEEINRILTDQLASVLWTPSADADDNLLREGVPSERISRVGNCMIDSLVALKPVIDGVRRWESYDLDRSAYTVVTLHRPVNVDDPVRLKRILDVLSELAEHGQMVFPIHPRTRGNLEQFGLLGELEAMDGVKLVEPLGYLDFISLVSGARSIVTDSGGIQEETSFLGVPCLTIRPNTERPVTCTLGTNVLVEPEQVVAAYVKSVEEKVQREPIPLWDGKAGERIAEDLRQRL